MFLALMLIGCGLSEDAFITKAVDVGCSKSEECSPDSFSAVFSDQQDCIDQSTDLLSSLYTCYIDNCDSYDSGKASDCISAAKGQTCEEYTSGDSTNTDCENIWTECDDTAVNTCLAAAMGF